MDNKPNIYHHVNINGKMVNMLPCKTCGRLAKKKCQGCEVVRYCDRKCQKADWPNHKSHCECFKKIPKVKTAGKLTEPQNEQQMLVREKINHLQSSIHEPICKICGDSEDVRNMRGFIICKDCIHIQSVLFPA